MGGKIKKSQNGLQAAVLLPSGCMSASGSWSPDQHVEDYSLHLGDSQAGHYCLTEISSVSGASHANSTEKHLTGEKTQRNGES